MDVEARCKVIYYLKRSVFFFFFFIYACVGFELVRTFDSVDFCC